MPPTVRSSRTRASGASEGPETSSIPNRELVVYVLSLLGGESKRVHTEDIAAKCHELFPASFSWTKYTSFPDKDIVRVALVDARKEQWGALVQGRSGEGRGRAAKNKREPLTDGWLLTASGIQWVRESANKFESLAINPRAKSHRQKILKELTRVRSHPLFGRFSIKTDRFSPSLGEIAEFLRCRVDAPSNVWASRFDVLLGKANMADQADIVAFLTTCRAAYLASP